MKLLCHNFLDADLLNVMFTSGLTLVEAMSEQIAGVWREERRMGE